jgi:hypothetical protein
VPKSPPGTTQHRKQTENALGWQGGLVTSGGFGIGRAVVSGRREDGAFPGAVDL